MWLRRCAHFVSYASTAKESTGAWHLRGDEGELPCIEAAEVWFSGRLISLIQERRNDYGKAVKLRGVEGGRPTILEYVL